MKAIRDPLVVAALVGFVANPASAAQKRHSITTSRLAQRVDRRQYGHINQGIHSFWTRKLTTTHSTS